MSFFDEADEPQPPRAARRRPRPGGRGRPPGDQQAIQTRRIIAVVVGVIVIIVMALLIHSCQVSQTNSSLKDYNNGVSGLITRSDDTGKQLFSALSGGESVTNITALQSRLDTLLGDAQTQLTDAQNLSVPSQMSTAQQNVLSALRMRVDGIQLIASNIQQAMTPDRSQFGVSKIAEGTARFYASDVTYKSYATPEIAAGLNGAGIPTTDANGPAINPGQFLTDLIWLNRTSIATEIGAHLPSSVANTAAPGVHGHSLNSVSVNGAVLSAGGTATLQSSPAPVFTLNLTNGGQFTEYDVACKVSVSTLSDTGTATIAQTKPGETTTCSVPLPSPPTPGSYTVTATVEKVPGEKNTTNNTQTFAITFK